MEEVTIIIVFFGEVLSPNPAPISEEFLSVINNSFGSFDEMKQIFLKQQLQDLDLAGLGCVLIMVN